MLSKCNIGVQTGVVVYYLVLKTTQQKLEKFEDLIDVRYEWWLEFNFLKKHCDLSIHYPQRERERERERERVGMHGRGSRGAAPASDAATHEGRCWPRVGPLLPRGFFFFSSTRANVAETWLDSRWIVLIRADSGVSVEIGETAEMAGSSRFRPKFKHSLSLRHSSFFSVLSAVCVCSASLNHSLPLCLCSPSQRLRNNTTQMLLCWPVTKSCNIKRLWLPKMPFSLYSIGPPSCTQSHVAVLVILPWCTCVGWDGYSAWSDMSWLGERVGHFFFVLCFLPSFFVLWI